MKYLDTETGFQLPAQYGRCDREVNCGYHLNPYSDGYWKEDPQEEQVWRPKPKPKPVLFPTEIMKQTLRGYDQNTFVKNLIQCYGRKSVEQAISMYYLGTVVIGFRAGAVTFPFIDVRGGVRAVQVKQFDDHNHTVDTDFLHSIIERHHTKRGMPLPAWLPRYMNQDLKVSCLFGEHLIPRFQGRTIGLVEAPKTAIYGFLHLGNLLWLAVYNLSSLNIEKCLPLAGRKVILFPDLSVGSKAYELWSRKAVELQKKIPRARFTVSDFLERRATAADREKGLDLADYLAYISIRKNLVRNALTPTM